MDGERRGKACAGETGEHRLSKSGQGSEPALQGASDPPLKDSYELIRPFLEDADREVFVAMPLDIKNQPTSIQTWHIGSLNTSLVHPPEVLKMAILSNAASIIGFHNHPSGSPEPSKEDLEVTKRLKAAEEIVGVELLDHLIIGDDNFLSFREKGIL